MSKIYNYNKEHELSVFYAWIGFNWFLSILLEDYKIVCGVYNTRTISKSGMVQVYNPH